MLPVFPLINQPVEFSYSWLANYVNESGILFPLNASFYTTVTRNGNAYSSSYLFANANADAINYNATRFNITFSETGNYVIQIRGIANSTLGNQTFESLQGLTFAVGTNATTIIIPGPGPGSDTRERDEAEENLLQAKNAATTKPANSTVLILTSKEEVTFLQKLFYWVVVAVIILLVAVILVYIIKFLL
jgi:hypothetical protein